MKIAREQIIITLWFAQIQNLMHCKITFYFCPLNNNRDKGFSILHRLLLCAFVLGWLWVCIWIWEIRGLSLVHLPWNYAVVSIAGIMVAAFGSLQNYGDFYMKNRWERIRDSFSISNFQIAVLSFFVFGAYFASKDSATSRLFLGFYLFSSWPVLLISNFSFPGIFKRLNGYYGIDRKAILIGSADDLSKLGEWFIDHSRNGYNLVGGFCTQQTKCKIDLGLPYLGNRRDLESYLSLNSIHQIIVIPDGEPNEWISSISEIAQKYGCRFLIYNSLAKEFDTRLVFMEESGRQFFTLLNEPLESPFNKMIKRIFDLSISIPTVVLFLPLLMALVKFFQVFQSQGPLFFKQERVGVGGNKFTILKFRSMEHEERSENEEAIQAHKGDSRIFPFGSIMRRFSIDEFPQFINVLKGEMSLVGPRPYLAKHDYLFQQNYRAYKIRQFVKPGVTGPAQCRGLRGEFTDSELVKKRIELDFDYVGNWSLWMDVEIVLRTIGQVIFPPKSAY